MRVTKFRAWDKSYNKIFFPNSLMVDAYGRPTSLFEHGLKTFGIKHSAMVTKNSKDVELMQYTGLKDKNGKEIYEGDIILYGPPRETFVPLEDRTTKAKVHFTHGSFNTDKGDTLGEVCDWHECEVIGNIYENPELLNG